MLNVVKTVGILLEECVESFNRGAVENGIKTIYLRKINEQG